MTLADIFRSDRERRKRPVRESDEYSRDEVRLANRNHGTLLETLKLDITPTGAHYLLNHFDVPVLDGDSHRLRLHGAFAGPCEISIAEIRAMPAVTMPVTLECAGNGRAGVSPRSCSMPWMHEGVGTSEWTGTPLKPLIDRVGLRSGVRDISFAGADVGFDKGQKHAFGRSLTPEQVSELDALLVYEMNGQPLLPQHGAPLRLIVPGWYGMASIKWLTDIEALTAPYQGFQQIQTYRLRQSEDDPGHPVTAIRVKSLMVPPGVPDWLTRSRFVESGRVAVTGRAWSGSGVPVKKVELGVDGKWTEADVTHGSGRYAWSAWSTVWNARPGAHILCCRATDADGYFQPLEAPWDAAGFANNAVQEVEVFVGEVAGR